MTINFKKGFTLIELLVVVSIIGILATLVAANLNSARSRARDTERKSDLKNIQTALRLYYNDNNTYPADAALPFGSAWSSGTTVYMEKVPDDPVPGQSYLYALGADTDTYTLSACLENLSDATGEAITIPGWDCPSNWVYQVEQ